MKLYISLANSKVRCLTDFNSVKSIGEVFMYFKKLKERLVFIVKLEGVFVSFKETSGEVSVFFPKKIYTLLRSYKVILQSVCVFDVKLIYIFK
jgi:uncharacterized membrane protein